MKNVAIAIAVIFGLPFLVFAYFYLNHAKIVVVRNSGDKDVEISMVVANGVYLEKTEDKLLKAHGRTFVIFFPRTEGYLSADCTYAGHTSIFLVAMVEQKTVLGSSIALDSCNRMISRSGFVL